MKTGMILFSFLSLLVLPGFTRAEEGKKDKAASLEEVVVTATRTPTTLDRIGGSSVTVITENDIEAKKKATVEEVLKGVPGIDISAKGGPGTVSKTFIRGADSKNTLILVDGVMVNDPSDPNRGANLANLTVDNIERIEIVRGPLSVLYGSNATAGVINIITKKGEGKPTINAGLEGGSYGTWKTYGESSGAIDKFNFSLNASGIETDGFSAADDKNDSIPHNGNTSEDDGWKNTTLSWKFGFDIIKDFDIDVTGRYLDSELEFDDWGPGYAGDRFDFDPVTWLSTPNPSGKKDQHTDSKELFGRFNVHNYFFDRLLKSTLSYKTSDVDRQSYDNDGSKSWDYNGKTHEVAWQGELNPNDSNILSFGGALFEEKMESDFSSISEKDADVNSLWAQDQLFLGDSLVFVPGIRVDDHDRFGSKTTYRLAPSYTINQIQTTFKGSYGSGFRAPSLFELYSSYGNEDLGPEKSEGWDIGFEQGLADNTIRFGVTYFCTTFEDRIDYDFAISKYNQLPGKTKSKGVESFIEWGPFPALNFLINYTYNGTQDADGKRLAQRPLNKVHLNARYRFLEKAMCNLDISWVGDRDAISYATDENGNQVDTLGFYFLADVSAQYDISDHLQAYGRIDNLFDEEYEEAWSYAAPGFSVYAGIKVTH